MTLSITQVGFAVIAALFALFTLAARDQRSPYSTNSVYAPVFLLMLAVAFAAVPQTYLPLALRVALGWASAILLFWALLWCAVIVVKLHCRRMFFRDDLAIRHYAPSRYIRHGWRRLRRVPTYEHNPARFSDELLRTIEGASIAQHTSSFSTVIKRLQESDGHQVSPTVFVSDQRSAQLVELLADLAARFLASNSPVQYTAFASHPYEFFAALHRLAKERSLDWSKLAGRIVLVDAYTPHYGYADSIYDQISDAITTSGANYIRSGASYAGVHTAAARAFNLVKKSANSNVREPALVIYDQPYSLVELESVEQYRVFVRHVIPSERLWGSMLTVFAETVAPSPEIKLLKSYADYVYETRGETEGGST